MTCDFNLRVLHLICLVRTRGVAYLTKTELDLRKNSSQNSGDDAKMPMSQDCDPSGELTKGYTGSAVEQIYSAIAALLSFQYQSIESKQYIGVGRFITISNNGRREIELICLDQVSYGYQNSRQQWCLIEPMFHFNN